MDVERTGAASGRRRRQLLFAGIAAAAVAVLLLLAWRMPPAAPSISRASIWTGRVSRGPMLRDVRGTGVLIPLEIRWIPALQAARVEELPVQPGATVAADTVIMRLSNPEIVQSATDARLSLEAARADFESRETEIESELLAQRAAAAAVSGEAAEAERRLRVEQELARAGLSAPVTVELARTRATTLATRRELEERRVAIAERTAATRRSAARAHVTQVGAVAALRRDQEQQLLVRAGIAGVVQQLPVQVGQQVAAGTILAKVARPDALKAELRIPETQARDIQSGQRAVIDTRNGVVIGRVARVDPASQNGTVTVDVALPATLPKGARPDLTVDGTIELERVEDTLWLPRPMQVEERSVVNLFKVVDGGRTAVRVKVQIGRASASAVEIVSGLAPGDEVILSDMSAWSGKERLRIE